MISVIIPYYNDDITVLKKCLCSILIQSYSEFEIIIIDDGSTDENSKKLLDIIEIDSRITVFKTKNQGVSAARNEGLKRSKGEYIVYIDADDIVVPWFFQEAIDVAKKTDADVMYSFAERTNDDSSVPPRQASPTVDKVDDEWLKKHTVGPIYKDGDKSFGRGPWARFLKRSIVEKTEFPVGIPIGEDVIWNLEIIRLAKKKYIIDQIWYKYINRSNSVTTRYNPEISIKLKPFYHRLKKYINEHFVDEAYYFERLFIDLKSYVLSAYLENELCRYSFIQKWKIFNEISNEVPWIDIGKQWTNMKDYKMRIKALLFRMKILYPILHIKKMRRNGSTLR